MNTIPEQLLAFIEKSPDCFHAVAAMKEELAANGFKELKENEKWQVTRGGRYFVTRNESALIAFTIPEQDMRGMRILATHSDSPSFKIKENPEMEAEGHYIKLNVEKYGGMLCAPWFDRPLSVAGRVVVKDEEKGGMRSVLVNLDRDLVMIPSLAIHMNREVNDGYKYNAQKDMLPLYGDIQAKGCFMKQVAEAAGVKEEEILGHDLFLYNRQKGCIWGAEGNLSPAAVWMTCSALLRLLRAFLPERRKNIWRCTVFLIMKRQAARQSRARRPPSFMIRL